MRRFPSSSSNPQVPIKEGDMSNVERREDIHWLNQVLSTNVDRDTKGQVNPKAKTTNSRIRYFMGMNHSTFFHPMWRRTRNGY